MFSGRTFLFYPLAIALFFPVFLYAENFNDGIPFSYLIGPSAVLIVASALLILIAKLLIKDNAKASVIVSMVLVVFFVYGAVYELLVVANQELLPDLFFIRHRFMLPVTALGVVAGIWFVLRSRRSLVTIAQVAGAAGVILILLNLGRIGLDAVAAPAGLSAEEETNVATLNAAWEGKSLPDIYYIILDSYGRADSLKETHGYDNNSFIDSLTQRGFYVAAESRTNYIRTINSLGSSLNMRYLVGDDLRQPEVQNTAVLRSAKQLGYEYVHLDSSVLLTRRNAYADVELLRNSSIDLLLNDFSAGLLRSSLAAPVVEVAGFYLHGWWAVGGREQFHNNMNLLKAQVDNPKPTFTFNHNFPPHPPYIFDRDGNFPDESKFVYGVPGGDEKNTELYIDSLIYINKRIEEVVDHLIERSDVQPIIIIQGDHGTSTQTDISHSYENPSAALVLERTAILNALYLPDSCKPGLYPSISPVNTFRLVFGCLGANLPLLEDKSYWSVLQTKIDSTPIDFSRLK
jgi:hypothetical protein